MRLITDSVWIVSSNVFEVLCPVSEVRSVGNFLDLPFCVFASPPVVLVVTVPFSDVGVDCEDVFSDSDCEHVDPQTTSLSRKNAKGVLL